MSVKKDYWLLSIGIASWIGLLAVLPRLPDRIPLHWNIAGQPDRWGSKFHLVWLGSLGPTIWLLMTMLPHWDPGRANYRKFAGSYRTIRLIIVLLMSGLAWLAALASLGGDWDVVMFVKILLGLVFLVIGNLLTRVRPNWFTGIRTPWTLDDPVVWRKTHRLGGYLMVLAGLVFLLSAALMDGALGFWLPMAVLIGGVAADIAFSAVLWRRRHPGEANPPLSPRAK